MVIREQDGEVVVEIKGLDVHDPTTGVIRSSSRDDIACWFLDTNYTKRAFSSDTLISPARANRTKS